MLPADGSSGQLHALKTDASLPPQLSSDCGAKCKFGAVRLGREWWVHGKCVINEQFSGLCREMLNRFQVVFMIDLPRKSATASDEGSTLFYENLIYFLKAATLHDEIIAKLSEFDFSETADIAFVHTM